MANPSEISLRPLQEETPKKVKTTKSVFNEDLISRLPDEILSNILSFVPTKTAVATSVLSKRWIRIWISVPNLDFGKLSTDDSSLKEALFLDFVDRVLSLNNVLSVRKVELSCRYISCESSRVTAWISNLFRRDAEVFLVKLPSLGKHVRTKGAPRMSCRVQVYDASSFLHSVPDCFFNQNNLVELKLQSVVMKVPSSVWFPKLKTISFHTVHLCDDDSIKNLLFGCPVLGSLTMDRGIFTNAKALYFCSYTLNYLKLIFDYCGRDFGYSIVIDAPNVTHLYLTDEVGMKYNAINLPSLVEVTLDVEESVEDSDEKILYLLSKISHVKELILISRTMRPFGVVSLQDMPMFHKLIELKVQLCESWSILPHLFHCTPNLVTLALHLGEVHPDCAWYENEPLDVPQCYSSSIEFVEIFCFEDCEEEMGMIVYILKNAMVLKKLSIISFDLNLVEETKIRKSLLILPRSSSECLIEYKNECAGEDHSWSSEDY